MMKPVMNKKKKTEGLLYGLIAGLAFSIFAWGIDFILLTNAHVAYSWAKFIPGIVICTIAGALVGWLTFIVQKGWFTLLAWFSLAFLFSKLAVWIPFHIAPVITKLLDKNLASLLNFIVYPEFEQYFWFGFIAVTVLSIICGLLENVLIEQSQFSSGSIAIAVPLLVCFLCLSLAGIAIDSLINNYLRAPVQAVDELIQFAVDNTGKEVPSDVARAMHLAATKPLQPYLANQRRLILVKYDESLFQMKVAIDFDGKWSECNTVNDQVTYCLAELVNP